MVISTCFGTCLLVQVSFFPGQVDRQIQKIDSLSVKQVTGLSAGFRTGQVFNDLNLARSSSLMVWTIGWKQVT